MADRLYVIRHNGVGRFKQGQVVAPTDFEPTADLLRLLALGAIETAPPGAERTADYAFPLGFNPPPIVVQTAPNPAASPTATEQGTVPPVTLTEGNPVGSPAAEAERAAQAPAAEARAAAMASEDTGAAGPGAGAGPVDGQPVPETTEEAGQSADGGSAGSGSKSSAKK